MAAANAIFWTSQGWDGSEELAQASRQHCTQLPETTIIRPLSGTTVKTVILMLQGAQAVYGLMTRVTGLPMLAATVSLDSLFAPLSVLGMLRLFAALWLTDDFGYMYREHVSGIASSMQSKEAVSESPPAESSEGIYAFLPISNWRSRLLRLVYITPLVAFCITTPLRMFSCASAATISAILMAAFYLLLLAVTVSTHAFYFAFQESRCSSTLIPCISSRWYKVYTCVLWASLAALVVTSSLENRRTPCAKYTTFPDTPAINEAICPNYIALSPATRGSPSGIVTPVLENSTANGILVGESLVKISIFSGACLVDPGTVPRDQTVAILS